MGLVAVEEDALVKYHLGMSQVTSACISQLDRRRRQTSFDTKLYPHLQWGCSMAFNFFHSQATLKAPPSSCLTNNASL